MLRKYDESTIEINRLKGWLKGTLHYENWVWDSSKTVLVWDTKETA